MDYRIITKKSIEQLISEGVGLSSLSNDSEEGNKQPLIIYGRGLSHSEAFNDLMKKREQYSNSDRFGLCSIEPIKENPLSITLKGKLVYLT